MWNNRPADRLLRLVVHVAACGVLAGGEGTVQDEQHSTESRLAGAAGDGGAINSAGLLTNLSVSGAMLASKTKLGSQGQLLVVKFRMDIREVEFLAAIDATIRHVAEDGAGGYQYGIQFAGLSSALPSH